MTRARLWVWAVAPAIVMAACAGGVAAGCERVSGGTRGAEAQLRFLDVNDGQVVFTFGPSAVSDTFGVPEYTITQSTDATGLPALAISFRGASMRERDGSTSYGGPLRIGVNGPHVLDVALSSDVERTMIWEVAPKRDCPRLWAKTYVYGKSPRAQLALTFGGMSPFTLESTSDFIGTPQDTPVQVSGMGFASGETIVITAAGHKLWDTTSDKDGNFDSGFNIGYPAPGVYTVVASDAKGHRGVTSMTVILPTNPFR